MPFAIATITRLRTGHPVDPAMARARPPLIAPPPAIVGATAPPPPAPVG